MDATEFLFTEYNWVDVKYRRSLLCKKYKSLLRDKNNFLLLVIFASKNNPGRKFFVALFTLVNVIYMMHFANWAKPKIAHWIRIVLALSLKQHYAFCFYWCFFTFFLLFQCKIRLWFTLVYTIPTVRFKLWNTSGRGNISISKLFTL